MRGPARRGAARGRFDARAVRLERTAVHARGVGEGGGGKGRGRVMFFTLYVP